MAIQGAFGWENSHLFEFIERQSPRATRYGARAQRTQMRMWSTGGR
jgi:hypothetical protein